MSNKFHCDVCSSDVTNRVRISCAECEGYDLCISCFSNGASTGSHKPYHKYRVIEQHCYPIYDDDWGADEELLLIEGAQQYGIGNWQGIADHIGFSRSKEEVENHYHKVYLDSKNFPFPDSSLDEIDSENKSTKENKDDLRKNAGHIPKITPQIFAQNRKKRIEKKRNTPLPPPKTKPIASTPLCHEIQGYMPGRLEFETEYENDAEVPVKDMTFDPDDQPGDIDLKLSILHIYNSRLTLRAERKKIMIRNNLLEYKKNLSIEKKKTKEERELFNKIKPFIRIMTPEDFQKFSNDILLESQIRNKISQLQNWRNAGLTTIESGFKYEKDKSSKSTVSQRYNLSSRHSRNANYNSSSHLDFLSSTLTSNANSLYSNLSNPLIPNSSLSNSNNSNINSSSLNLALNSSPNLGINSSSNPNASTRKNVQAPLDISNATDVHLLSMDEQKLCSSLRILPKPYMAIKETLFREILRTGGILKKRTARELLKIDVNKTSKIYEFFLQQRWLKQN
ncbi:chromatin-binding transcription regulator ADA2 [Ascoidea rubescens DSM 1968]|uniref:Transcriptional adapter 2 n=1 Tax=Ascoidea rubescens DSM 1968 TaxID=1344418 RepID=A0A1D2VPH3_9ASCO|nr:transcriptional adaptor 2 [Ascoidea rubescens DSM 1968]ODV63457.1 transcriptional adaptor 2 [Ascoidea rubescens DSM 1968]